MEPAAREVVRRRQAQRERQLPRPPRPDGAPQQGGDHLGRGAGRPAHAHVLGTAPRGEPLRERPEVARRRSAATAWRSTCRWCPNCRSRMLACARIGAMHSVVFGGFSSESLRDRINDAQAKVLITADGGYRRGGDRPAEGDGRRGAHRHAEHRARRRAEAGRRPRHAGHDDRGARRLVPRRDEGRARVVRARGDGRRGHALHPLHVRHHREAQGHRPHDRRVPHGRLRHDQVGLRPQGRRCLLVHRRHRLGDRPQLRGLRAAGQRRDRRDVRRGARLARARTASGTSSSGIGVTVFYTAPTAIRAFMRSGPGVAEAPRHEDAAPDRQRRRADQPRGVDVVLRAHRRPALPGGGHVVADRDGAHPDHAAARHHHAQAGFRDARRSRASRRRSSTSAATR